MIFGIIIWTKFRCQPSTETDILLNGWLLYQSLACRMWARTAFYQAGGAYGFRDQLQDSLALLHTLPEKTREQIVLHAVPSIFRRGCAALVA